MGGQDQVVLTRMNLQIEDRHRRQTVLHLAPDAATIERDGYHLQTLAGEQPAEDYDPAFEAARQEFQARYRVPDLLAGLYRE